MLSLFGVTHSTNHYVSNFGWITQGILSKFEGIFSSNNHSKFSLSFLAKKFLFQPVDHRIPHSVVVCAVRNKPKDIFKDVGIAWLITETNGEFYHMW